MPEDAFTSLVNYAFMKFFLNGSQYVSNFPTANFSLFSLLLLQFQWGRHVAILGLIAIRWFSLHKSDFDFETEKQWNAGKQPMGVNMLSDLGAFGGAFVGTRYAFAGNCSGVEWFNPIFDLHSANGNDELLLKLLSLLSLIRHCVISLNWKAYECVWEVLGFVLSLLFS